MNEQERVQAVINTLELMEIRPTYANVKRLAAIFDELIDVRNSLTEKEAAEDEPDTE